MSRINKINTLIALTIVVFGYTFYTQLQHQQKNNNS